MKRCINSLDQNLPPTKENKKNKLQIVNFLVEYIKSGAVANKAVILNQKSECFFVNQTNTCVCIPELNSLYRGADLKTLMHVVYAGQDITNKVCLIADDTGIYLSLINIAHLLKSCLCFLQGKTKDKEGITYDIHAIANHHDEEICSVLPAFRTLTGSDFTNTFFNRFKIQAFKKMLRIPNSHKILLSLPSEDPNISEVIDFVCPVRSFCSRVGISIKPLGTNLL